jgi:hypothetical protein
MNQLNLHKMMLHSKDNLKRTYHSYDKWEEYHAGMWKSIYGNDKDILLKKAIEFTGNAKLYGSYMVRVISEWPYSCEHNLTCSNMNRQAWIGHAACCLAIGCPEDITRIAWHHLSKNQQDAANLEADRAIKMWEDNNKQCLRDTSQLTFFHLLEIE